MAYFTDAIGERIRLCRKERGMTQEQLAEKINIAPNYLGQIENGHRGVNLTNLIKIANELEITFDYLLSDLNTGAIKNSMELKKQWEDLFLCRTPSEQRMLINIVRDLSKNIFN